MYTNKQICRQCAKEIGKRPVMVLVILHCTIRDTFITIRYSGLIINSTGRTIMYSSKFMTKYLFDCCNTILFFN